MIDTDYSAQRQSLCLVTMVTAIELSVCSKESGKDKKKWET